MTTMSMKLKVTKGSGAVEEVAAGQREMAEWEQQPFGCSSVVALQQRPVLYLRYMAYAAQRRSGALKRGMSFDSWSEDVDEVAFADDETPAVDPTPPGRRRAG